MAQDEHTAIRKEEAPIQFAEFLETVPPGSQVAISNLTKKRFQVGGALLGHQI